MIEEKSSNLLSNISNLGYFIVLSLQEKNIGIDDSFIDSLTIEQFENIWKEVVKISGVEIVPDSGNHKSIDWALIYGCLSTSVGWTFREIDEHTLPEVEELLDYLADHPTAASILAAVHQVKTTVGSLRGKKWKDIDPDRLQSEFQSVAGMVNQKTMGVSGIDDELRESMQIASELEQALKKKAN